MPKPEKVQKLEELYQMMSKANALIFTDFKGLTVADLFELRSKIKASQAEYRIVKNTLALRAIQKLFPEENLESFFIGPTAITYCYDDSFSVLKTLVDYMRDHENLKFKGGIIDKEIYSAEDIKELAKLPPKEVILSQLVGSISAPVSSLVWSLNWTINKLVWALDAIAKEKEKVSINQ
ncbi:MAG TPA: 50S ribosomal protein L10 [Dictyoglomaceae bacterium]|nr:50S ribosomal protein L10 [Dictyoglomaceae bacterium]HOL38971.1 50S ribosomal protein L10 [Dictyoglomaceae bacterium]HOP94841.1 50S ribosomal protein L10 [Dictyoglomaceae bacterium]HPP15612.1 50S ribosomal protein L10 [Dictyoglomaceae bacterium]HPU43521.1 50S ribosomal protein L10 [Dictyoglomaceae bacterium]